MDAQLRLFRNRLRHALCWQGGQVAGCHVPSVYSRLTGRHWKDDVAVAGLPTIKTLATLVEVLPDFELVRDGGAGVLRVAAHAMPKPCHREGCTWGFSCNWHHDVTAGAARSAFGAPRHESHSRPHAGHHRGKEYRHAHHGEARYAHHGEPRYAHHGEPRYAHHGEPRYAHHGEPRYAHHGEPRYARHGEQRRPRQPHRHGGPQTVRQDARYYGRKEAEHHHGTAPRTRGPHPRGSRQPQHTRRDGSHRQARDAPRAHARHGHARAPLTVAAAVSSAVAEVTHTVDAALPRTAPPRRRHAADVVADGDAQLAALLAELGVAE